MEHEFFEYIVWVDYGSEGWSPYSFDTLEAALLCESYGSRKIITKQVKYKVEEVE